MRLSRPDRSPTPAAPTELASVDGVWSTLSVAGVSVAVLDPEGAVVWCNPAFADLSARTPDEMIGQSVDDALGIDRTDRIRSALHAVAVGEAPMQRTEVAATDWAGTKRSLALSASMTDAWDEPGHIVVVAENLTADRRRQQHRAVSQIEVARRASEDALTGLPNRATFEGLLDASLRRAARQMIPLAVMCCDLDGFRVVNERLGDAAGDQLLQWVATRLTHTLRHHDLLARFRGDEFIVVAEEVGDEAMAHQVARRLAAAISEPIVIDGIDVRIGVSIGFTIAAGHERPADLIAESERAMEGAKRAGKGRSMSLSQVIADDGMAGPATIDWNELAVTAPS